MVVFGRIVNILL